MIGSSTELIIGLVGSICGGLLVAIVNYLSTRGKIKAEANKLDAEAEKLRAETRKVLTELAPDKTDFSVSRAQMPDGWYKTGQDPQDYEMGLDFTIARTGKSSAFIKARPNPRSFATMMQYFNAKNYHEKRLRLSGYIKVENVVERAWLWMRIDGSEEDEMLGFDNMEDRPIEGTHDWRRYEVVLDVSPASVGIAFGFALAGSGQVWADDLEFEVVNDNVQTTDLLQKREPQILLDEPINLGFEN